MAAVHALAYPLGGHFHVPHGLSNALVLPHVLRFNADAARDQYAELADVVLPGCSGMAQQRCAAFIDYCAGLSARTGIATRLSEVGVREVDLDMLADDAMLQTRLLVNNPREVTRADALAIYQAAY